MKPLDELIENEDALCNGLTLKHLSGSTTRRIRVARAARELADLRAEIERLRAENAELRAGAPPVRTDLVAVDDSEPPELPELCGMDGPAHDMEDA